MDFDEFHNFMLDGYKGVGIDIADSLMQQLEEKTAHSLFKRVNLLSMQSMKDTMSEYQRGIHAKDRIMTSEGTPALKTASIMEHYLNTIPYGLKERPISMWKRETNIPT